jgi:predicted KAP-like P-loop ATPase
MTTSRPQGTTVSLAKYISADRAAASQADDLFNRGAFSNRLADAIATWANKDSLVIGLYGPWGSGKSSLKNFVVESLRKLPVAETKPILISFEPWQFSGEQHLTQIFFRELAKGIGRENKSAEYAAVARKFRELGDYLAAGGKGSEAIAKLLPNVSVAIAVVGLLGFGLVTATWARIGLAVLVLGASLLNILLASSSALLHSIADAISARVTALDKPLEGQRKELHRALAKLKRPVLIVVDDLDRLVPDEVRQILKVVKSNADIPGLIYLLLCQRDVVEDSLGGEPRGRAFLEKIVQIPIDVPAIPRGRLHELLAQDLNSVFHAPHIDRFVGGERWASLFIDGLDQYFRTLRDVRRFIAGLAFHAGIYDRDGVFEVNPLDLAALETLRIFEPELYQRIASSKGLLTNNPANWSLTGRQKEKTEEALRELLEVVPEERRQGIRSLLRHLFPHSSIAMGFGIVADDEELRVRERRVCTPEFFLRYFEMSLAQNELREGDVEDLVKHTSDRQYLVMQLRALEERGLLADALSRLEAYKRTLPIADAVPFVAALFDIGDDLPDSPDQGFFFIRPEMHAIRIVSWYLRQEPLLTRRTELFTSAFEQTVGLYLPVSIISMESGEDSSKYSDDERILTPESYVTLRALAVDRIRQQATSGRLGTQSNLAYLLYRWKDWSTHEEVVAWIREFLKTDRGPYTFVSGFVQDIRVMGGGHGLHIKKRVDFKELASFLPLEELESATKSFNESVLNEKERATFAFFRQSLKSRLHSPDGPHSEIVEEDE